MKNRLIELFGGIGSQAKALTNIGADFEHYRLVEFDKYAVQSYNAIHGTNFIPQDITKTTAKDLNILDTSKYNYIMTYSFPCQDLSLAGNQKGMAKGTSTRSGLLWEVERILKECNELPQVLLMENVPQVHGTSNKQHFEQWQVFLESLGYSNYYKDLNAKNFTIPQNRYRCFMVSLLSNRMYTFPKGIELKLRLKDMLESEVDEKYYLTKEHIERIRNWKSQQNPLNKIIELNGICPTITARGAGEDHSGMILINDNGRLRNPTPKETLKLMGFSEIDYYKAKNSLNKNLTITQTYSQLYKQAGNSIVVNVLEEIFKSLFDCLENGKEIQKSQQLTLF